MVAMVPIVVFLTFAGPWVGEALYGFEGLRAWKDKFSPLWEPRYIAGPDGVGLARALIDLQTLVGGGQKSVARRAVPALAA